jgi:hypothetical protein
MAVTIKAKNRKLKRSSDTKPTARKVAAAGTKSVVRAERLARRLAQKHAAFAAVAHITSQGAAEFHKNNPAPASFWAQPTAK